MGFSGGIAVANSSDFKFDMPHFKIALREQWSDIQIKDVSEGNIDFGMTMKGRFDDLVGSTIKQQQIGWWGSYEEFAEFCVWLRKYIPDTYQLLAWSKNANDFVVVTQATTEEQFVRGLSDDPFDLEITSSLNTPQVLRQLAENFKRDWQEYVGDVLPDDDRDGDWFLRSQRGQIEYNNGKIIFADNDLRFAAHFAIWCRNQLASDQKLTVRGGYYPQPERAVEIQLTSSTTENELYDFLMKSFPSEQS